MRERLIKMLDKRHIRASLVRWRRELVLVEVGLGLLVVVLVA